MKKRARKRNKLSIKDLKHLTQFNLSENNRLTYVYEYNSKRSRMEIVCVSLEIRISEDWITIIYYDNHHDGILHRHKRIAYNNQADIVDYEGVKRKGSWTKLLRWSIEDIKNNYLSYKRRFIRRNKVLLKEIEVEEY